MEHSMNVWLIFAAGFASVLSPCVLPVVPIVVTGKSDDHRFRPVLIVSGLAATFILMGVVSSLFGSVIGPYMSIVEKAAGVVIIIFGALLVFNVNIFKYLGFISNIGGNSRGRLGGFALGALLGVIWIPCVGPMLSGVLAIVATRGEVLTGILLLSVYSAGFAVPMLIAGYASQFFRKRMHGMARYQVAINIVSGLILLVLGILIVTRGIAGLNF